MKEFEALLDEMNETISWMWVEMVLRRYEVVTHLGMEKQIY